MDQTNLNGQQRAEIDRLDRVIAQTHKAGDGMGAALRNLQADDPRGHADMMRRMEAAYQDDAREMLKEDRRARRLAGRIQFAMLASLVVLAPTVVWLLMYFY